MKLRAATAHNAENAARPRPRALVRPRPRACEGHVGIRPLHAAVRPRAERTLLGRPLRGGDRLRELAAPGQGRAGRGVEVRKSPKAPRQKAAILAGPMKESGRPSREAASGERRLRKIRQRRQHRPQIAQDVGITTAAARACRLETTRSCTLQPHPAAPSSTGTQAVTRTH